MDIRHITNDYAVSPQIEPQDFGALKAAGFVMVINNRPDAEVPPPLQDAAMRAAAEAAGLAYVSNPVVNGAMTQDNLAVQARAMESAGGPVFAWCRTGTRCSIVWALGQAGSRPTPDIVEAIRQAGYDVPNIADRIDALADR